MLKGPLDRIGPLAKRDTQYVVNVVVLHQQFHVTRVRVILGRLKPQPVTAKPLIPVSRECGWVLPSAGIGSLIAQISTLSTTMSTSIG